MFSPTRFIYNGGNSESLRGELEKYERRELLQIYRMVSGWELEKEVRENKELLIEEVVRKTLSMCNRGWIFHPNTEHLESAPYK